MEFKVWVDGIERVICGVQPQTTTCRDIVLCLAQATQQFGKFVLIEKWRQNERLLAPNELPIQILNKWGDLANEVCFIMRRSDVHQQIQQQQQQIQQQQQYLNNNNEPLYSTVRPIFNGNVLHPINQMNQLNQLNNQHLPIYYQQTNQLHQPNIMYKQQQNLIKPNFNSQQEFNQPIYTTTTAKYTTQQQSPQLNAQLNHQISPQLNSQLNAQLAPQLNAQLNQQMNAQLNANQYHQQQMLHIQQYTTTE